MSQRSDEEEESFLDWEREKRRQKDIRKRLEETEWVSSEEESDDGDKADSGSDGSGCAGESNGNDNGIQKSDEDDESSSSEEETETAEEKKVREEEQKRKQEEELEKKRKEEEGIHFLLRKYFPESLQKEKAAKERDNETDSDKNPKRTSWGGTDAQRDPKAPLPTAAQSLSSSGLLRTSQPNMESKATSTPTSTQGHRRSHSTSQTHAAAPGTAGAIPRLTLSGMDNIAGDAGVEAAGATVTKKAMSPRGDASPGSVASRSNNRRSVILGGKDKQKETKKKEKEKARTPHKEVKREVSAVFCYSDRMMMMDREEAERRRQQELRLLQMREEEKRKQQQAATVQSTSPVRPSSMEVKLVHGTTGDPAPASKHASGNSAAVHSAPDAGPQVNKNMQRWELLLHIPQESLMKARQERLRLDLQKNTKAQKHLQRLSPRALEKTISELLLLDPEAGEKLLAERIRQEKERKLKLREDDKKRRSRNERAGN